MLQTTDAVGSGERPGPGRPRIEALDEQILGAAVALLDAGEEITVSKVVKHSGVSRAALYRRWPSITALTAAALDVGRSNYPEVRIDENLRETLFASLMPPPHGEHPSSRGYPMHRFFQRLKLMIDNPELQHAYWESHVARRRAPLEASIAQAIDAGHLRADLDAVACVDALAGIVYYQLVVRGTDLRETETQDRVRRAFDTVWQGMVA